MSWKAQKYVQQGKEWAKKKIEQGIRKNYILFQVLDYVKKVYFLWLKENLERLLNINRIYSDENFVKYVKTNDSLCVSLR